MGLEPTTFSLGSWNGLSKSRWTSAVRRRLGATSRDMRGQEWTPGASRTSADKSDRGSGGGAAGGPATHLQAFGLAVGQYGTPPPDRRASLQPAWRWLRAAPPTMPAARDRYTEESVTQVPGQKCYPCARLHSRRERPRFWRWSVWAALYAPTGVRPHDGTVRSLAIEKRGPATVLQAVGLLFLFGHHPGQADPKQEHGRP